jgi:hypothetical protein
VIFALLYTAAFYAAIPREDVSEEPASETAKAEAITFLAASVARGEMPKLLLLLRLAPDEDTVTFALLPAETTVETEDGADMLGAVWSRSGGRTAADALSRTASVPIDCYLTIPPQTLVTMIDRMGTIDWTAEDGESSVRRQVLDGSRMLALAAAREDADGETARRATVVRLVGETLRQRVPLLRSSDLEKLYLLAVNAGKNDLTAADYESRRSALCEMLTREVKIVWVAVDTVTSETDGGEKLSAEALTALGGGFGGDDAAGGGARGAISAE